MTTVELLVSNLTMHQLKKQLLERGLATTGQKKDLVQRLSDDLESMNIYGSNSTLIFHHLFTFWLLLYFEK